jgi:predicted DNA-binding transcriptional regulator YafY
LELPYSDERGLIADILGFGPEVVFMGPASLKDKVFETVKSMINVYKISEHHNKKLSIQEFVKI